MLKRDATLGKFKVGDTRYRGLKVVGRRHLFGVFFLKIGQDYIRKYNMTNPELK